MRIRFQISIVLFCFYLAFPTLGVQSCDALLEIIAGRLPGRLSSGDAVRLSVSGRDVLREGYFLGRIVEEGPNSQQMAFVDLSTGRIHLISADRVRLTYNGQTIDISAAAPIIAIDEQVVPTCLANSICNALRQRNLSHEGSLHSARDASLLRDLVARFHNDRGTGEEQLKNIDIFLNERVIPHRTTEITDDLVAHLRDGGTAVLQYSQHPNPPPWGLSRTRITEHLPQSRFSWSPFPWFRNISQTSLPGVTRPVPFDGPNHATIAIGVIERPAAPAQLITLDSQSGGFEIIPSQVFRDAEAFAERRCALGMTNVRSNAIFTLIEPRRNQ